MSLSTPRVAYGFSWKSPQFGSRHGLDQNVFFGEGGRHNILGREEHAAVFIDSPMISRRHAKITVAEDRVILEDLGSKNGTYVSNRRITVPTELIEATKFVAGPSASPQDGASNESSIHIVVPAAHRHLAATHRAGGWSSASCEFTGSPGSRSIRLQKSYRSASVWQPAMKYHPDPRTSTRGAP